MSNTHALSDCAGVGALIGRCTETSFSSYSKTLSKTHIRRSADIELYLVDACCVFWGKRAEKDSFVLSASSSIDLRALYLRELRRLPLKTCPRLSLTLLLRTRGNNSSNSP